MKPAFFFALVIASASAYAQQVPAGAKAAQEAQETGKREPGAEKGGASRPVPSGEPQRGPHLSDAQLSELLRAQTAAILSLSSKLDSLEKRIDEIETRRSR